MKGKNDTTCSKCGRGVNWEDADYNEETGEVLCPHCQNSNPKQSKKSKHEYRYENVGKRPR